MNCLHCNEGTLEKRKGDIPAEVRGEELLVHMDALVCSNCNYTTVEGARMEEYMRLGADAYRLKHALLTSSEIRTRRRALRMNQEQFASYLGVGPASIKRWELGQIQDQAMDRLIRLMTNPRCQKQLLKRCCARGAVRCASLPTVFHVCRGAHKSHRMEPIYYSVPDP